MRSLLTAVLVAGVLGFAGPARAADPPLIAPPPAGSETTGALVGITAADGARVIAQKWLDPRTVDLTVRSPAVGHDLPVRVIVPAGWSPKATRTWPLLLVLHGGASDYTSWTANTDLEQLARPAGLIVAMPEAGRTAAYTDYVRTTSQGPLRWETFHTTELIQILTRGLRASGARAVLGISAGGYGAVDYTARHPGLFRYTASFSGALGIDRSPLKELIIVGDQLQGTGFARYGDPNGDRANWNAHDPYQHVGSLRGTGLYLYSGDNGLPEEWINDMNRAFLMLLNTGRIPVTSRFAAAGGHSWPAWQAELHRAWPRILAALVGLGT